MDIDQAISTISMLPISDRLRVIHAIWDSLPEDLVLPLSEQQQAEIDRRLQAHEDNPGSAIGHDELMRRIKSRR